MTEMLYYYWRHLEKQFINWDPDMYDWKHGSRMLAYKCAEYIHIWWDPKLFNWHHCDALIYYCHDYFEIWYDPKTFPWRWYKDLNLHHSKYKHIWELDYLIYKLKQ